MIRDLKRVEIATIEQFVTQRGHASVNNTSL